jgi:hypothetical protein
MQIYRRMDIGTAKATAEEQAEVPHHLIDIVDAGEPFSASRYLEEALAVAKELSEKTFRFSSSVEQGFILTRSVSIPCHKYRRAILTI